MIYLYDKYANQFFLFILFSFLSKPSVAQLEVKSSKDFITKVVYSIQNEGLKVHKGYLFPEVEFNDSVKYNAYELKLKKRCDNLANTDSEEFVWHKIFKKPLEINLDSSYLNLRHYIENVRSYHLQFHVVGGDWFGFSEIVKFEKYQLPILKKLSSLKKFSDKTIQIDEFKIIIQKNTYLYKPKFAIEDFRIFYKRTDWVDFYYPFFDNIANKYFGEAIKYNSLSTFSSLKLGLTTFAEYCRADFSGDIQILSKDTSDFGKKSVILALFKEIIIKYPFYEERKINKELILSKFLYISHNDSLKGAELIDSLASIVKEFKDPHFSINKLTDFKRKEYKENYGIIPYLFGNNLYVGGVLDTTLNTLVSLGARILQINNKPTEYLLDSLRKTGIVLTQEGSKDVFNYLFAKKDYNWIKIVNRSNDTLLIDLKKVENPNLPENFKPKHGYFKVVAPKIAYYRLNIFDFGDYLRFLNYSDLLKKQNALIIDLRNNPGGYEYEAMRIASCLIKTPEVYNYSEFRLTEVQKISETNLLLPNKVCDLSHLKIVILININSFCTAESFSFFLKNAINATIIGNSDTQGAYAHAEFYRLPYNYVLRFNCLNKKFAPNHALIECKGIQPDIYVTLLKVEDLYPYEDKILKTAITYLQLFNEKAI